MGDWNYKEIKDFHDRVRELLDFVDSTTISNERIDTPEKAPVAEKTIKSKLKDWQNFNESDFALFETAIVYLTASFFESFVMGKKIKSKKLPNITIEHFSKYSNITPIEGVTLKGYSDMIVEQLKGDGESFIGFMVF